MGNIEIWRDIPGYENSYQVSNLGQVRSLNREIQDHGGVNFVHGIILKQWKDKKGYHRVELRGKSFAVHRLVLFAFIGDYSRILQVNHKDGNKGNNFIENLEWVTAKQNSQHAEKNGLRKHPSGENVHNAKITNKLAQSIRNIGSKRWSDVKYLAKIFEINETSVHKILLNQSYILTIS